MFISGKFHCRFEFQLCFNSIVSLPPANEVWGKVIFLHLFVILFMGGYYPSKHCRWYPIMPCRGVCYPSMHRGCLVLGGLLPGGCLVETPGWLLLRAVRILLECILVFQSLHKDFNSSILFFLRKAVSVNDNTPALFSGKCHVLKIAGIKY